jgi:hypothetical protein
MSVDHYEIAWRHATNEIAEIDAQIQRLTSRKELLENLLEPLKLLVCESGSVAIPATPVTQPEMEETNIGATRNGRSIPHEEIAGLAYRFWSERGQVHGLHEDDWFRAAHELQNSVY